MNGNSISGPSSGFLDIFSTPIPASTNTTPNNNVISPTPMNQPQTPTLLTPTPAPLKPTDKNYYRSLFGSLSTEEKPAPPPTPTNPPLQSLQQPQAPEQQKSPPQPIQPQQGLQNMFSFPAFTPQQVSQPTAPQAPQNAQQPLPFSFPTFDNQPVPMQHSTGHTTFHKPDAPVSQFPLQSNPQKQSVPETSGNNLFDFNFPAFAAPNNAQASVGPQQDLFASFSSIQATPSAPATPVAPETPVNVSGDFGILPVKSQNESETQWSGNTSQSTFGSFGEGTGSVSILQPTTKTPANDLSKDDKLQFDQSGIPIITEGIVSRWENVLQKCIRELKNARENLQQVQKQMQEANFGEKENMKLLQAPRVGAFTNGIYEVYKLIKRLQSSIAFYESKQPLEFTPTRFQSIWKEADSVWKSLFEFLSNFGSKNIKSDAATVKIQNRDFVVGSTCGLCLLPLGDIPNLKWVRTPYHSACANFYCNRISTSPPVSL